MQFTRRDILKTGAASVVAGLGAAGCSQSAAGPGRVAGIAPATPAPDQPIRTGFIGVGGRGTGLLRSFLKLEGQQVVAVCDTNQRNAERAAGLVKEAQGHDPQIYSDGPDDYKRLLESGDIHAVVTAAPCFEHARMMIDAIAAGKHIYGEKPMGLSVAEVDAVVATAEANPRVLVQVGFQWMASPRFIETIGRVHNGDIGELIEGRFFRHNGAKPMKGWFSSRAKSGDWMLEQACHEYNIMNWVAQATPLKAYGMGRRDLYQDVDPGRDVTDYYAAIIEYPNNFIVHYAHGWISPDGFREFAQKAIGTRAAIEIGGQRITAARDDIELEPLKAPGGDDTEAALGEFVRSIRSGTPSIAPVSYGRNATLTALLVRKAVDERREVTWRQMLRTC
jgi:myo-inositol 2-dehydrogenase / D-chiro-inositol 1-dehydrogenase